MDSLKSQDNFYVDLMGQILSDDPHHTVPKHLRRDIETVRSRCQHEGVSFLTKTLPKLGKALDLGLSTMHFNIPREFKGSHANANIPAFLQEYFKCIFGANGDLLENAPVWAVSHCRQVCFAFYKLEIPFTDEQIRPSLDRFVETDESLPASFDDEDTSSILEVASFITKDIFRDFDHRNIFPRHGPGAVATGEKLDDKWEFSRLYSDIHSVYPYYDYFMVGSRFELASRKAWYMSLARLDHGQAKVIAVPKDSRGPRLISCEPLEFQWIQQGLGRKIVSHLETHPETRGKINFTDQSINRKLALHSSTLNNGFKENILISNYGYRVAIKGSYATLDLKDASDRVSIALVSRVFSKTPELLRALLACRSSATILPDGREVVLKKYAPMGSALCFPVEAFCFWVLLVASISRASKLRQSDVGKLVYVYGDDILVPVEWADFSIHTLEKFSLSVNSSKCCIHGPFRESCGMDAFKGVQVTPIRFRTLWSGDKADGSAYVSWISSANQLAAKGYTRSSDFLWQALEELYGKIPYGTSLANYPCKVMSDVEVAEQLNAALFRHRNNRRYQRVEFLLSLTSSRRRKSWVDGWPRLLRDILTGTGEDPSTIVVPRSMLIKRGWTATF